MDGAITVSVICVSVLVYNLYKIKHTANPMDELLKAKQLLDEGIIESADYEKIKKKSLKRIVSN